MIMAKKKAYVGKTTNRIKGRLAKIETCKEKVSGNQNR
jgi:hypothetical protein